MIYAGSNLTMTYQRSVLTAPNIPFGSFVGYFGTFATYFSNCMGVRAFTILEVDRTIRLRFKFGCGGMYMSLALLIVIDTDHESLDKIAISFAALRSSALSKLPCPSSVLISESKPLCYIGSGPTVVGNLK